MKCGEIKFVATVDGEEVVDGQLWIPKSYRVRGYSAVHPVKVTSHGIIWTFVPKDLDSHVTVYDKETGKKGTFYLNWECEYLSADGVELSYKLPV